MTLKAQLTSAIVLGALGTVRAIAAEQVTPPAYHWTGVHFGGLLVYASGQSDWTAQGPSGTFEGSFDFFRAYDAFKGTGSYFGGLQAGDNYGSPSGGVLGFQ